MKSGWGWCSRENLGTRWLLHAWRQRGQGKETRSHRKERERWHWNFQPRWRHRNYTLSPCTTKRRTTNLKTKKHADLPENRTVWKSDNQGVEEIFIKTGRKEEMEEMGSQDGEDTCKQGGGWRTGQPDSGWRPHVCMQINWEQQLGSVTA